MDKHIEAEKLLQEINNQIPKWVDDYRWKPTVSIRLSNQTIDKIRDYCERIIKL